MSRSSLPTATEQALFECEARYRNLYDRIPAMLLSFDRDRRVVRVSNDWLAVMGYERAEVIGRDILEFVTEDSRRRALAGSLPDLESAGVTRNLSRQIVKRNGEVMEVLISAVAESGAAGEEESFLSVTIDTTELRRAEESLRATEARLGAVVSAAPIAMWAADRDGTITLSEGKALERLGLKPGELVGRSVFDLYRDFPQDERNVPRAFAGEAFTDVFELDEGVFTSRYQPLRDANGEVDGVVGVDLDVTEHARAEKALRESEDRYRTLIEMSPDAILVQSDGIVVFANENAVRMLGGDPVGRAWADFVHPVHLDDAKRWCARMLGGEALPLAERVHVRADGSEFAAEVNAAPSVWAGKPALQVVIRDITERRRAQQQQERTRLLLRAMTEGATDGIFVKDPQGRYLMMNQAGARILGMEREDILGKTDAELLPARLARAVQADDREIAKNGETRTREDAYVRAGAERILQTTKGPCRDVDGRFIGLIGVTQDVTERKRTEQALRQSEERFRTLVEYAPEAVVLLDLQTRKFVEANTNAERLFGMPKSELLKRGPEDISPPRQPGGEPSKALAVRLDGLAAEGGEVPPFEWLFRDADGKEIPCEVRLVRLFLEGRTVVRGSVIDISERKELEERLAASQRLDAVGQLTSGVAHEFNNLLTAMLTNLQTLRRRLGGEPEIASLVEATINAGWRGAGITRSLLAFVRKQPLQAQSINVRKLISEVTEMLQGVLGRGIEIRIVTPTRLGRLEADPGLLQAALVNLALNARDAMPGGGTLTIEAASVRITENQAKRPHGPDHEVRPGRYLSLAVSDTGCGIAPEVLPRVFEPFFTTKDVGQGTGLGLSAVYGFAKQSNGYVTLTSRPGHGTRLELALPLKPRKRRAAPKAARP